MEDFKVEVTQEMINDETIDANDPCGCHLHKALMNSITLSSEDIVVDINCVKIDGVFYTMGRKLRDWHDSLVVNHGIDVPYREDQIDCLSEDGTYQPETLPITVQVLHDAGRMQGGVIDISSGVIDIVL